MRVLALLAPLLLAGCVAQPARVVYVNPAYPADSSALEPIGHVAYLAEGHRVSFSRTIASVESQAAALALLEAKVGQYGLPSYWSLVVVSYPIHIPKTVGPDGKVYEWATSDRDFVTRTIHLTWWGLGVMQDGKQKTLNMETWGLGDANWEIELAAKWQDDFKVEVKLPPRP